MAPYSLFRKVFIGDVICITGPSVHIHPALSACEAVMEKAAEHKFASTDQRPNCLFSILFDAIFLKKNAAC